jgi:phage shock protein A
MSMSSPLSARVGRIISGGLNALIDAVEGMAPEAVMEQAIREVDAAVDEVRSELGRTVAAKHLANTRLMEENRRHEDLAEKIEIAVGSGRDDLAETAIAQQIDIEAQIPVLEQAIAQNAERERELEGYVRALLAKRREMQTELAQFRASRAKAETAGAGGAAPGAGTGSGVDAKVRGAETAFDRVLQRTTGLPGRGGSRDLGDGAKLAELEALARDNRVKERLAAVKAKTRDDGAR